MAAPGFTCVYASPYRGGEEEWTQQYHVDSDWDDVADFHTAMDEFATMVHFALPVDTEIHRFYGYHDTDNDAFNTYDVESEGITGAWGAVGAVSDPGDVAVWCRWNTERTNTRGKLVYLRKYFHNVYRESGDANRDLLHPDLKSELETFASAATGTGWNGHHLAGPDGLVPGGGSLASTYTTTRTLKRRGRRP